MRRRLLNPARLAGASLWCILLVSWFAGTPAGALGQSLEKPPNIVVIVADDLGYGELGCQGNDEIPTVHIDDLANNGIRFTQAYVTGPNCSPSRAGLFSGRTPTRFGYEFNPIGARNEDPGTGMPKAEQLLPEYLRTSGYVCGLVGKWHLGGAADYHPHRHGFDFFFGFTHEGHYFEPSPWANTTLLLRRRSLPQQWGSPYQASPTRYYGSHMHHDEPAYDANNPIVRDGQPVAEPEYLTDALAREAAAFIDANKQTPFFLALTFNAVHSPLQARNETLAELSSIESIHRRIFAAMLLDMDRAVGRVTQALDHAGVADNTIVFFLSDNGGPTRELTSSNAPLRGEKGSMYEGGLRVPFIMKWPGSEAAGQTCDAMISSMDIYATCQELLGEASSQKLDGRSLQRFLHNADAQSAHEELFWRQGGRAALRSGDYKIVAPGRSQQNRQWELYNIPQDLAETADLASQRPEILEELVGRFETLDAQMSDPLF